MSSLAFESLAFESLAFESLVFESLAFESLAFKSLVFESLAVVISRHSCILHIDCNMRTRWRHRCGGLIFMLFRSFNLT